MSDTDFFVPPEKYARLARVYTPGEGGVLQYREEVNSNISAPRVYKAARGGLVSTATDYARFCQMLLNGGCLDGQQILGRKTVELMTANQTGASRPFPPYPAFPAPNGYGFGLGFRVLLDPGQSDVPSSAGEYGWGGAYGTYFWIDPREQLYGILMAQLSPPDLRYGFLFQSLAYQALVA
jgi:CubicO group peptidase (beta-lactamase class C family)